MRLTPKEYGALDILLSSVSLDELINAAKVGFLSELAHDETSSSSELINLCTFLQSSLNDD